MLTTSTVEVWRDVTGDVAQSGMVDPWEPTDDTAPVLSLVCRVPAGVVRPSSKASWNGGVRQKSDWRLLVASGTDVRIGDTVRDTARSWRVESVEDRQVPSGLSVNHVACDLVLVDGEA